MGLFGKKAVKETETNVNNEFRYADKTEQLIRTNNFLMLAYTAYYMYIMALLATSLMRGERSLGLCGMIGTMVVIALVLSWIVYLRNNILWYHQVGTSKLRAESLSCCLRLNVNT